MFTKLGRFLGTIKDAGLEITPINEDTGKGELPVWHAYLQPTKVWDGEQWTDLDNDEVIRFDAYLYSHAGDPIFHCQNLVDAIGWNGNLPQLFNMDYSKCKDVQFQVENETFTDRNGKEQTKPRVKWVQAIGYEPQGFKRATKGEVITAAKKFNSFKPEKGGGGTAADAASPASPKSLKPKSTPKAVADTVDEAPSTPVFPTADAAWEQIQAQAKQLGVEEQLAEDTWMKAVETMAKDKNWPGDTDEYTSGQIQKLYQIVLKSCQDSLDIPF